MRLPASPSFTLHVGWGPSPGARAGLALNSGSAELTLVALAKGQLPHLRPTGGVLRPRQAGAQGQVQE